MIFEIKRATVQDVHNIQTIGRETFYETFHENNDEQTMKHYLQSICSSLKHNIPNLALNNRQRFRNSVYM